METAVLLIGWKRPDTIGRVLEKIAQADPARLYVSLDGPRSEVDGEANLCEQTLQRVLSYPDRGRLHLRRPERNSGARGAILGAMDWFFSQETEGIILEDDSLPTNQFFDFCSDNLQRFRHDSRVFQIAGTNHLKNQFRMPSDSYASCHMHIWGFGTWSRSWEKFKLLTEKSPDQLVSLVEEIPLASPALKKIWKERVRAEAMGHDDNWDSTWNLAAKLEGAMSITSSRVTVTNIGYDSRGLHSHRIPLVAGFPPQAAEDLAGFPRSLSQDLEFNSVADKYTERVQWSACNPAVTATLAILEKARRVLNLFLGNYVPSVSSKMPTNYLTVAEKFWSWWGQR